MLAIKKILFPTDFSDCAEEAFIEAVNLARQHQAELHILHAIVLYSSFDSFGLNLAQAYEQLQAAAQSVLAKTVADQQLNDITIKQIIEPAISASALINSYAQNANIDLIVMGTHGRQGLTHLFLGSVAEAVIRTAPCPVMAIHKLKETKPTTNTIKKILVPIDFSEHSKHALIYAKELAQSYQAQLQLLHVIERPPLPAFYSWDAIFSPESLPDVEAESKKALANLSREFELSTIATDIYVINGKASRDIAKFAEEHKTDLIVISTHGLTGLKHLLIGSTTEKVIRSAPCPAFIVKAFGKELITRTEQLQQANIAS